MTCDESIHDDPTVGDCRRKLAARSLRRLRRAVLTLAALGACGPACAGLDQQTIAQAGFRFQPGAQLPMSASVVGAQGPTTLGAVLDRKPALLLFVDYRCRSLCGVMLDELADVIPQVNLDLGRTYSVVTVALDDAQTREDADAFRDQHTRGSKLRTQAQFLTEGRDARMAIWRSVGLVAPFDSEHRQFAHPAALVVVDAHGQAQQLLSPFALNALDVTLALSGSGPSTSSLGTRLLHLCYGWDPLVGQYTLRIERILSVIAAGTVAVLAGGICLLLLAERQKRSRVL